MLAACLLAAISLALVSCDWFGKKKHFISEGTLLGKWTIDSVRNEQDHSAVDTVKRFGDMAFKDSSRGVIDFASDSLYSLYNSAGIKIDSNKYYIDSAAQKLYIKQDTSFSSLSLKASNDSSMQASSDNEPVSYYMKKQP